MGMIDSTTDARIDNNIMRHQYKILNDLEKAQMQTIKDLGLAFYTYVNGINKSREISLSLTKIEEAVMWAVKDITK